MIAVVMAAVVIAAVATMKGDSRVFEWAVFGGEVRSSRAQARRRSRLRCVMEFVLPVCVYLKCERVPLLALAANAQDMTWAQQQGEASLGSASGWRFLLLLSPSHVLLVCARVRSRM